MSHTKITSNADNDPEEAEYKPNHDAQTEVVKCYDHWTSTEENVEANDNNFNRSNSNMRNSKLLISAKHRSVNSPTRMNTITAVSGTNEPGPKHTETFCHDEKIIIPTKYRLRQRLVDQIHQDGRVYRSRQRFDTQTEQRDDLQQLELPSNEQKYRSLLAASSQNWLIRERKSEYDQQPKLEQQNDSRTISPIATINQEGKETSTLWYDLNKESSMKEQQEIQLTLQCTDQDHKEFSSNRYRIVSGNLDLQEIPSDNNIYNYKPKHTQMHLVFKATFEGSEVKRRAHNSIPGEVKDHSRSPSMLNNDHDSKSNVPNQHKHDSSSKEPRTDSNGLNNASDTKVVKLSSKPSSVSSPRSALPLGDDDPNHPRKPRSAPRNDSSLLDSASQKLTLTTGSHDNNDENSYDKQRPISRNNSWSNGERSHLNETDNKDNSLLSSAPSSSRRLSEYQSRYFFGEINENQSSDEDSDEAECVTFGHDPQSRPHMDTNQTDSDGYSSVKRHRLPNKNDNYQKQNRFGQRSAVTATTGHNSIQQQRHFSTINQLLDEKYQTSKGASPTFPSNYEAFPSNEHAMEDDVREMHSPDYENQNDEARSSELLPVDSRLALDSDPYEPNNRTITSQLQTIEIPKSDPETGSQFSKQNRSQSGYYQNYENSFQTDHTNNSYEREQDTIKALEEGNSTNAPLIVSQTNPHLFNESDRELELHDSAQPKKGFHRIFRKRKEKDVDKTNKAPSKQKSRQKSK